MIYTYKCNNCQAVKDKMQKVDDPKLTKCEECGQEQLERIITGGHGFHLKGKGWYKTGGYGK